MGCFKEDENEDTISFSLQMKMKILDFALKILILLNYFLSLEIQQNKDGLHISQKKHVSDILKRIGMES